MQLRRRQLVIITSLHTAITRQLAPAPDTTQEEAFKASFLLSRCLFDSSLTDRLLLSARYCLAPAVTPFSPRRPALL